LAKQQGRNYILLDHIALTDYAFRRFHHLAALVGRNKTPGFTERQAIKFFSAFKMIMNTYLEGAFSWDPALKKDIMALAKRHTPIRCALMNTFDLVEPGPNTYKIGDGTSQAQDGFFARNNRINVGILPQIQAMGDNNNMPLEDLRDKCYLLLKFHMASRDSDMKIDLRQTASQTKLYATATDKNKHWPVQTGELAHPNQHEDQDGYRRAQGTDLGTRVQEWNEANTAVIWIFEGKTGTRSCLVTRIRVAMLKTPKIAHLATDELCKRLDLFEAIHALKVRTRPYTDQMTRSVYAHEVQAQGLPQNIQTCWINVTQYNKFKAGQPHQYVSVQPSTLVTRLKKVYRRSGWHITDDETDNAQDVTEVISGIKTIAGHISRSHAASVWDYFGLKSAVFHSSVAQERAGHTKATFYKSYSRLLPETLIARWELHPNNIYLTPDEILFV
jgi:hypothetical protein